MLKELKVDTSAGPEDLDKQLRVGADSLKKLLAEKVTPLRQDSELVRLAGLADRAQLEGLIALAKDYRAKAAARADNLGKTLDQRQAEVKADRLDLASTYADYAETAILAFDFKTAADQYAKAYQQAESNDDRLALRYKIGEADALNNYGDNKGDNDALRKAIETYQAALALSPRESDPENWAMTQNNLGNALSTLGERESGSGCRLSRDAEGKETRADPAGLGHDPEQSRYHAAHFGRSNALRPADRGGEAGDTTGTRGSAVRRNQHI
ncbi:hypothetical protein G5V57_07515 [Nordella sp. HKS 07]|uniref:hypothetical protein n=1 Tax=Nordella sp. HKS 07 TaxID=2712222 RepID=UPI0013E16BFC|nr:hypothetical protein [Nordella sp. HKS 07]QIG47586.1 hypothetical protein G5V57_07515 [Nordella sp. HKS 07]